MSSLSASKAVFAKLMSDARITAKVQKIFPVVADEALLPYIAYRRTGFEQRGTKAGQPGADEVRVELAICAATYAESVELAELARACMDGARWRTTDTIVRSCWLAIP